MYALQCIINSSLDDSGGGMTPNKSKKSSVHDTIVDPVTALPPARKPRSNATSSNVMKKIEAKLRLENQKVSNIIFRHPISFGQGLVHYELLNVEDDEDVELMFDVYKQWLQLGFIELYVTFEDGNPLYDIGQPSSSTTPHPEYHFETQNTYSFQNNESYQPDTYQPEPYFDQAETSEPEPSQPEPYIPLGDMADFDQQEISGESEEETYFDEDEDDECDNDNGDDLELTYDPPFHMCNLNLDYTYQYSEFDMPSNEPPPLDASLEIGMKFNSKPDCQLAIKHYHIKYSLNYRVVKSDQYMYVIKCVNPQCLFKCTTSLSQKSKQWVIGRLKGPHDCANSSMSQDHTKLDSNIICESIKSLLKVDPSIKVKVIIAHIRERYNYTITYRKVWMSKNKAIEMIYGNWEKSYNDIPRWLLTMQKFLP
uniref:Uncharacterized protein LOC105851575 n=1 Tax=Cicer arietinum TaxID=3827 RepID=A0A1S3DYD6_CICAR|nr:uncharacterized protein LOC105851575 [Cicer arietinum]